MSEQKSKRQKKPTLAPLKIVDDIYRCSWCNVQYVDELDRCRRCDRVICSSCWGIFENDEFLPEEMRVDKYNDNMGSVFCLECYIDIYKENDMM